MEVRIMGLGIGVTFFMDEYVTEIFGSESVCLEVISFVVQVNEFQLEWFKIASVFDSNFSGQLLIRGQNRVMNLGWGFTWLIGTSSKIHVSFLGSMMNCTAWMYVIRVVSDKMLRMLPVIIFLLVFWLFFEKLFYFRFGCLQWCVKIIISGYSRLNLLTNLLILYKLAVHNAHKF